MRARAALALLAASACAGPGLPPGEGDAAQRLERLEALADQAESDGLAAAWGDPRPTSRGLAPLLVLQASELEALEQALTAPDLRRRAAILEDRVIRLQVQADPAVAAATRRLAQARDDLGLGDELHFERALAEAPDDEARGSLWLARAAAAADLAPHVRQLARARSAWARRTHGEPLLDFLGRRRGYLPGTARRLHDEVAGALARDLRDRPLGAPWADEAMDASLVSATRAALPEADSVARSVAMLRWPEGPAEPAVRIELAAETESLGSYPVAPPGDVRVRLLAGAGLVAHWGCLHEVGHAAQALSVPRDAPPWRRRLACDAVGEGCAKLFERLALSPEWLLAWGLDARDLPAVREWEVRSERTRMRAILADTALERSLYESPDSDLDALARRLAVEVQGLHEESGLAWPTRRTLAFEALGRFDYLLARCAQAAITRRLRALPGGLLGPEAGRVLRRDVLEPAAGSTFEDWFERAAGTEPSCEAWIQDVAGLPAEG